MMHELESASVTIFVNGGPVQVREGISVAAALMNCGRNALRRSVEGESRGPVCGMGICYECRVTINGEAHMRSCMTPCVEGMEIVTDA